MPCYTEWDAYLKKDTKEYKTERKKLQAKLKAIKHIIDYYYGTRRLSVPIAKYSGNKTFQESVHKEFEIDENLIKKEIEDKIIELISYHFSCDEISFILLYDVVSLIDLNNSIKAGYVRVILMCANELRSNDDKFQFVNYSIKSKTTITEKLDPKRLP